MNLPLRIARRYFASKQKRSFISLIANISMLGVGIGAMALIIVLSIFNGLEDFNRKLFRTFDADLTVRPREGKRFELTPTVLNQLKATPGVASVTQVIEENALMEYRGQRAVVTLKGVDDNLASRPELDSALTDGTRNLLADGQPRALLGWGVQQRLSISLDDELSTLEVWFPRRDANLTLPGPEAFNRAAIRPAGVFSIEQTYDDQYVFVPLSFAQDLFEVGDGRSSLEITVAPGERGERVKQAVQTVLGGAFLVQTSDEQHADLLRAIRIEKLFVFITLSFIVAVASFNIFFSLTMLAIEKKVDVATLYALGATPSLIQRIFLAEGGIVALTGAGVGLLLGLVLCWLQQTFGLIKMGLPSALVDAYPVKMEWGDFLMTGLSVVLITIFASYGPARRAARQTL
jgi:lipoprotein-releasing system permease protein